MANLSKDEITEKWRQVMVEGHDSRPSSYLPGSPRCTVCDIPMGGVGGMLIKALRGKEVSRKNPQMCNI